jgi:transposase
MATVGIDVSKSKIDVTVLLGDKKSRYKIFDNNQKGFKELAEWLTQAGVTEAHVCLEATGSYGEAIALFMYEQCYKVSVINPARIKAYASSEGCRVKTDKVDSGVIARFCKAQSPAAWTPPSPSEQKLKELYRCRQSLLEDKLRVANRIESLINNQICIKIWKDLLSYIDIQLQEVNTELKKLLESDEVIATQVGLLKTIPGVSDKTAIAILSELPNIKGFKDAKEVAAFAGLTPFTRQSGSSLRGKGRLSKTGNSQLRKSLYMPTVVAKRYNPVLKGFCERLSLKGKPTMVVLAAGMRKLLHIIFGILKTGKPFTTLSN